MSNLVSALPADPGAALQALMIQSRGAQSDAARDAIDASSQKLEEARQRIHDAMERAAEARENSGFWGELGSVFGGDVAAILGVAAAAAATVATGGAGAPAVVAIAAASLTTASSVGRELGLDARVCDLLGAAGAVAGLAVGNAAGSSALWNTIATTARTAQAGATAAGAGAEVVAGQYEADALHAEADGAAARKHQADAEYRFDLALDMFTRAAKDLSRAQSGVADIQRIHHEGNTALIQQIGATP